MRAGAGVVYIREVFWLHIYVHKKKKRMQWPITLFRLYIQIYACSYWACSSLAVVKRGKATHWHSAINVPRCGVVRRQDKVINQSEYDFSSGFFFSLFSLSRNCVWSVISVYIYAVKLWDHCPFILLLDSRFTS